MKLTFKIDYHTQWGESIYIQGNMAAPGAMGTGAACRMEPDGADGWQLTMDVSPAQARLEYSYSLCDDEGRVLRSEWGDPHSIEVDPHVPRATVIDHWRDRPYDLQLYSTAFTRCINRRPGGMKPEPILGPDSLMLRVWAPMVRPSQVLAVAGAATALGAWDPQLAIPMDDAGFPQWSVDLPLSAIMEEGAEDWHALEYKFVILDKVTHDVVAWEMGDNRVLPLVAPRSGDSLAISGLRVENPLAPWHGAGVAIPVFSLRSNDDFGVGDFYDLKLLVDWAVRTGQKFIQILPVHDTTMTHSWADSYPYNAISTFALHPMYLRVSEIGQLRDRHLQSHYDALRRELNKMDTIEYEQVNNAKNELTRLLFNQQGATEIATEEYRAFYERNESWLRPYAAFCVLRDKFGTSEMSRWGEYARYDEAVISRFIKGNRHEVDYVCWLQYHLDRQMRHVALYAATNGVAIKGDIPIGISPASVDAWQYPELFNLDMSAGAPPDDFSVLGQNWGFPTYNWKRMSLDGYAWWRSRFCKMAEYFDAYRIDHVLGFFRIWQMPVDAIHGLLGVFNPALPLTPEEMMESFGFTFDADRFTRPYITRATVEALAPDYAEEICGKFLIGPDSDGRMHLRPEFSTQRAVAEYFGNHPHEDGANVICQALLAMIDDVLFIEDPYEQGKYHPRISGSRTSIYASLGEEDRRRFDALYENFYYVRHNDFWRQSAMDKLPPLIDATHMLVCAEDLGMIPACVPDVMDRLRILSLEIQRMPKEFNVAFADPSRYPYMSVCTTSTHDTSGLRGWWEENRELTQRYYNEVLHQQGEAPAEADPALCRMIIEQHLESPSMLCILPLQDWLSLDGDLRRGDPHQERINVPALSRHYWRYRMHLTLEQLLAEDRLVGEIRGMVNRSGR